MTTWIRVWRRPNGADPDGPSSEKVPGPWHALHVLYVDRQTWCGRRLRAIATTMTDDPGDDPTCPACRRALADDQPRSWRRR